MQEAEEALARFDRLVKLLEQEREAISGCLQGEILEEYRKALEEEIRRIRKIQKQWAIASGLY